MTNKAACIRDLIDQLGRAKILTDRDDLIPYETGARYGNGLAAFVVRPASTSEVSVALRTCVRHGIRVIPQGANTGLVGAATPDASGTHAILSLDRLTATLDVDSVNRSALVSAGVRLSVLNARLADDRLVFPIDLGADPSIGGMLATNTGGARFVRYGGVRRSVLGLEVVLADEAGTVLDLTGGLRKSNAGVDLKQLFIGTGGAFGIITRAEIEVQPLPSYAATALVVPATREAVTNLLVAAERALGETLTSFEGMSRNAMDCVLRNLPRARNPFAPDPLPDYALLIEIAGNSEENGAGLALERRLHAFLERQFEHGTIVNAVLDRSDQLWALRYGISEALRLEGEVIGLDISVRRGDLPAFHADAYALIGMRFPWLKICDFGHSADGGDHFNLVWSNCGTPPFAPAAVLAAREVVYALVVDKYRGSFSAEHGLGPHNQQFYSRFTADSPKKAANRLLNIFNPRGLVGRIVLDQ